MTQPRQVENPVGAFAGLAGDPLNPSGQGFQEFALFKNSGTTDLAPGDVVMLDTADTTGSSVVKATSAGALRAVGVCFEKIPAGQAGRVVVYGVVAARVDNTVTAGGLCTISSATSGVLADAGASPAVGKNIAIALEAGPASGTALKQVFVVRS